MAKIKTGELIDLALDWMVAKADDNLHPKGDVRLLDGKVFTIEAGDYERSDRWQRYSPSTVWAQAGPIIQREGISTRLNHKQAQLWEAYIWLPTQHDQSEADSNSYTAFGMTPLIAAMRCYVASKLGDEVDVPKELV